MRGAWLAFGVAGALGGALASGLVSAQRTPESLLPPGFDDPTPTPTTAPTALPTAAPVPVAPAAPATAPALPEGGEITGPIT